MLRCNHIIICGGTRLYYGCKYSDKSITIQTAILLISSLLFASRMYYCKVKLYSKFSCVKKKYSTFYLIKLNIILLFFFFITMLYNSGSIKISIFKLTLQ